MKILVPVRAVCEWRGRIALTTEGRPDTSSGRFVVDPYDETALDFAHRLRVGGAATEVVAVAVATVREASAAEETLRVALARAADRALLVVDDSTTTPEAAAEQFAAVAREEAPDLILGGKISSDRDDTQLGSRIAGILGWPALTSASEIAVADGSVAIGRHTDSGREALEAPLPALVTANPAGWEARPVPIPEILRAREKPLHRRTPTYAPAAGAGAYVAEYRPAPRRIACRMVAGVAELARAVDDRLGRRPSAASTELPLVDAANAIVGVESEADALAWIAGKRGWPVVPTILSAECAQGECRYTHPVYAGRLIAAAVVPARQEHVVMVRGEGQRSDEQRQRVADLLSEERPPLGRREDFEPAPTTRPDMGAARIVVAGGRGLQDAATFERIAGGLADALGGAVAASGGAVNTGMAPASLLVGQTGRTIAPDIYIALGISGADQHVAGCRDAGLLIAINTDPEAAIFGVADVGLVADVVPAVETWIAGTRR